MMRDEAVATADVEHFRSRRNYARYLQRHIVSAADFATAALARPTALQAANDAFNEFSASSQRSLCLCGESVGIIGLTAEAQSPQRVRREDSLRVGLNTRDGLRHHGGVQQP